MYLCSRKQLIPLEKDDTDRNGPVPTEYNIKDYKAMTEFEKMRNEEFYDFTSEECLASYYRAKHICARLQTMTVEDEDYRQTIEELIPGIPESSTVSPPFQPH